MTLDCEFNHASSPYLQQAHRHPFESCPFIKCTTIYSIIKAPGEALLFFFQPKNIDIFSYFSTKTYVVGTL